MTIWAEMKGKMGEWKESSMKGKTANSAVLKSYGRWIGLVQTEDQISVAGFKIFNSGGAFEILLGKPRLVKNKAVHYYAMDTLQMKTGDRITTLHNNNERNTTRTNKINETKNKMMNLREDEIEEDKRNGKEDKEEQDGETDNEEKEGNEEREERATEKHGSEGNVTERKEKEKWERRG
ncbi:hypothetical protein SERLADRAFT_406299 [Serpula lacrymans var. lacrymans S7.9]|nr:uncharacterized protein SERLADRAFT_406299 [Serpula lacrymans var. lacrymans S7.9]EGO27078.1 hypothetical protein SERLADRAFT_406299 [Serpula lacrymans var. lacrymans S7.9]